MNLYTGLVYNHTGYDVTDYFRSAVIEVKKTVENAASDGFALVPIYREPFEQESSNFTGIHTDLPYTFTGYNVATYFR